MRNNNEIEIVHHNTMNQLELFLVEMVSRGPHGHDDLEIGMILEGSVNLFMEQDTYLLQAGDIYIINRFQIHSFLRTQDKNQILAFQIHPDFYRHINPSLGFLRLENNIIHSGSLHKELTQRLQSCADFYFQGTLEAQIHCSSQLLSALALLLEHSFYSISSEQESTSVRNNTMRLNHIMDYISAHYMERISLEEIAGLEHITSYHASHFMKNMLGISFQEYLNQVRFQHALQLFENTSLTAMDVCLEVGFSSTRYLNQMFIKNFHCSYKEYQKAAKKPRLSDAALATENVQHRYSFAQSRMLLEKKQ